VRVFPATACPFGEIDGRRFSEPATAVTAKTPTRDAGNGCGMDYLGASV
jgi:hypothetical protein